ncbi:PiggyBac transposable element-derived protein 3 [Araneus ventricosus]|uniref:PiggyBac transposable element-derived protein 3 n=1 Tax=Araneus ventricosus TaxID=182803 RepID=A0A4Y2J931_ARAVE|nr:PiggyBac transposable element-derived protein 3 [Araneus ventricosus]
MLFSYHRLPRVRNYWSSDIDYSVPVVPDTLSRNRYFQILGNLHVNDNEVIPKQNTDRLYKIRPLMDKLNKNFQSLRMPHQTQSIDESMILFKGRSTLKQYNPKKPIKRGYKLWCRSDMSGYMYEFEVYQGKDDSEFKRFGLGGSVVQKLTKSLVNKNHIIMMDNFFSSVELYEYLKSVGIYACGTVQSNRKGLPSLAVDKALKRGDFDCRITDQGLSYFKWKDNRCVFFLSNYHGTEVCKIQRKQKDGSIMDIPAPTIVRDYNRHMGGVDKSDMLKSLYDRDRKAKKWWHRLFFGIIEIAMVNSYICYSDIQDKIPLLEYKRRVTQGLITMSKVSSKKRGRPRSDAGEISELPPPKKRKTANFSVSDDIRQQNKGAHWPVFVKNRGRCEFCASKKIESRPHSQCTLCKVFLCVNEKKNCFYQYHN